MLPVFLVSVPWCNVYFLSILQAMQWVAEVGRSCRETASVCLCASIKIRSRVWKKMVVC